ncbi:hypothetical protein BGZ74_002700 [Mortierella antarctica]|nr:hypothetical protein BGZ74_002700 [Mortierella antarctica]
MSEKTAQENFAQPQAIPQPPPYIPAQVPAQLPPQGIQNAPQPNYNAPQPNYNAPPPQIHGGAPLPTTQNPIQPESLRTKSDVVICHHCNCKVVTATAAEIGTCTYLSCGGLAVIGLTLFCCFIPFCVKAFKDIVHSCPNCKRDIALYSRLNKRSHRI